MRCGGYAQVIEGTFDFGHDNQTISQTSGLPLNPDLFARLGLILIQAKKENLKPEDIIERIGPHSPTLARRLSRVMDNPGALAAVIASIIGVFGAVAIALITRGDAQPQIINNVIIQQEPSDDELDRLRDWLMELRQKKQSIPSWVRDYIEPKES